MPLSAAATAFRRLSSDYRPPTPIISEAEAAWEYEKTRKFLAENLACTLKISQESIPAHFGKVRGTLAFETRKEIFHDGIFVLMKGISLSKKQRKEGSLAGKKNKSALKFKILSHSGKETREGDDDDDEEQLGRGAYIFEPGSKTYPLELVLRKGKAMKDFPVPIITRDGKLVYKFQGYLSVEGKYFKIAEIKVPYQGYYNLADHSTEAEKTVRIDIQLNYKKNILSKRKFATAWLTSDASGYLPGEIIDFLAETKNPERLHLKMRVELLEKLWYQEQTRRQRTPKSKNLSVKMKEILVASGEKVGESGEREMWKGLLRLPLLMTPSYKYDFLNSINYILRLTVMVVGDEGNGKLTEESPIYIGSTRGQEAGEDNDEEGEGANTDSEVDSIADSTCSGTDAPYLFGLPMMRLSRSMDCMHFEAESPKVPRPRAGSFACFKRSASYSQLSSRRPTLDTLPPEIFELELQDLPPQDKEKVQEGDTQK